MTSPSDDEVVRRLRALADHARTEPGRAPDEFRAVAPFRRAAVPAGRRWAARASVLVGTAAALIALGFVLAHARPPVDRSGEQTSASASAVPATTASAVTIATSVAVPAPAAPVASSSPPPAPTAARSGNELPSTVAPSTDAVASATTASATETVDTAPTIPTTTVARVPDGQFLGTVVGTEGDAVTWSVRCGRARDGGAIDATVATLPLVAGTVTADTGNEGTAGSVVLDVAVWRASRTSGLWWATVRGGRVTEVVAASLAAARCV